MHIYIQYLLFQPGLPVLLFIFESFFSFIYIIVIEFRKTFSPKIHRSQLLVQSLHASVNHLQISITHNSKLHFQLEIYRTTIETRQQQQQQQQQQPMPRGKIHTKHHAVFCKIETANDAFDIYISIVKLIYECFSKTGEKRFVRHRNEDRI